MMALKNLSQVSNETCQIRQFDVQLVDGKSNI